jgi:integrase
MRDEVFQRGSRERVAPNLYRRRTRAGEDRFDAYFRDTDGRLRTVVLKARTENAAKRECRALLADRDKGERVVGEAVTLAAFTEGEFFPLLDSLAAAGRRSEGGVALYRQRWGAHIEPVLGKRLIGRVEGKHVAELDRGLRERGYSESTVNGVNIVLRAIYRLAQSRRLISRNPVDELDPAERPKPNSGNNGRVLDETELDALARHASGGYHAVVTTLTYSGLRLSEALGLRWCDVDLVELELHVRGQLRPARREQPARRVKRLKSEASERVVPIFPAVARELTRLLERELAALDDDEELDRDLLVFRTRTGRPLAQRNVGRAVEVAAEAAGLDKVGPQVLRRSFCSLAGRRGVDPVEAAQMTGHSLDVWARNYARSFGKAQRDEARARLLEHGFGAVPTGPLAPPLARDPSAD